MADDDLTTEALAVLRRQRDKGLAKYGTTLANAIDDGLSAPQVLDHAIEEAADLLVYLVGLRRVMRGRDHA